MNPDIAEIVRQNVQGICGWTLQAKLSWFGAGILFGALVSILGCLWVRFRK